MPSESHLTLKIYRYGIISVEDRTLRAKEEGKAIYNFTKAGLNHFSSTLGIELAPYGIRVNALEPGWVETPGSTGDMDEEQLREARDLIPWGRVGQAEDIGKAVAFLVSDDADYVTSAMLRVDGGLIAAERKK